MYSLSVKVTAPKMIRREVRDFCLHLPAAHHICVSFYHTLQIKDSVYEREGTNLPVFIRVCIFQSNLYRLSSSYHCVLSRPPVGSSCSRVRQHPGPWLWLGKGNPAPAFSCQPYTRRRWCYPQSITIEKMSQIHIRFVCTILFLSKSLQQICD